MNSRKHGPPEKVKTLPVLEHEEEDELRGVEAEYPVKH